MKNFSFALIWILFSSSSAFAAGNTLTLSNAAYDTSAEKFGGGALSGGTGNSAAAPLPITGSYTLEAWIKRSGSISAIEVAAGQNGAGWIGVNASGYAEGAYGSGGTVFLASTVNVDNGAWHHVAMTVSASGGALYVDGAPAASSTTSYASSSPAAQSQNAIQVRWYGNGNNFAGEVDELAAFNYVKYTAAFTPPSSPYTGSETGLLALYHLDGNGADSSAGASITVAATSPAIYYSPYNWLVANGQAKTINGGAYFKTIFAGSTVGLNFTLGSSPYPEIYAYVDGQQVFEGPVAASVSLAIPSPSSAWPHHLLQVMIKGTSGNIDRWNTQASAAVLTGLTLASGSSLALPATATKHVLFYGDSITEGCWIYSHPSNPANDVDYYDGTLSWAYLQSELLGAEVGVVGFSRQGFVESGVGNVPAFTSTYGSLWSGQARTYSPAPDLVVINLGTNDTSYYSITDAEVVAAAETSLQGVLAATPPTTPVVVMRPFNGQDWADIQAAVAAIGSSRVTVMDTTGFLNSADTSDGLHPLGVADLGAIAPAVAADLKAALNASASVMAVHETGALGGVR